MTPPEQTVALFGILVVASAAFYLFCRWMLSGPRTADPWDSQLEKEVESDDAVPVCPHCLTPQEHSGWFCPECGSISGQYGNYLPSVYIFSIGEAARSGIYQAQRWNPLIAAGYILIAFGFFSLLAPIYCVLLFINRSHIKSQLQAEAPPAGG